MLSLEADLSQHLCKRPEDSSFLKNKMSLEKVMHANYIKYGKYVSVERKQYIAIDPSSKERLPVFRQVPSRESNF